MWWRMFCNSLDFDPIVVILFCGSTNELNFQMNVVSFMAAFPGRFLWEDLDFAA